MTIERLNELIHADEEGRILITPLAEGDIYFAVVRDCAMDCPYFSSFYGLDQICELDPAHDPHTFDGKYIENCPCNPYIQERKFKLLDYSFVVKELKKHTHIFLTRKEAEDSIETESPEVRK